MLSKTTKKLLSREEAQKLADAIVKEIEDTCDCMTCGKLLKDHTDDEAYDCAMKLLDSVKVIPKKLEYIS